MNRRRAMIGFDEELPNGYKRCKYLSIKNNEPECYIVLCYYKDVDFVDITFRMTDAETAGSNSNVILGYSYPTGFVGYDGTTYIMWGLQDSILSSNYSSTPKLPCYTLGDLRKHTVRYEIPFNKGYLSIGCYQYSIYSVAKEIYEVSLLSNGEISGHFIPALDKTGEPCMYDTVSKKPFYNAGTGKFGYELLD